MDLFIYLSYLYAHKYVVLDYVCFHCGQIYHIYVDLSMLSSNNVCLSYLCENLFVIYGYMNHCCMRV
jgi:hypothetical protein